MKKRLFYAFLALLLVGCVLDLKEQSTIEEDILDEKEAYLIILVVEDGVIEYRLSNETTQKLNYGKHVFLEKKQNNKWYTIDMKPDRAFDDIGYVLEGKQEVTLTFEYLSYYEALKPGEYRLVQIVNLDNGSKKYVTGTFTVR